MLIIIKDIERRVVFLCQKINHFLYMLVRCPPENEELLILQDIKICFGVNNIGVKCV